MIFNTMQKISGGGVKKYSTTVTPTTSAQTLYVTIKKPAVVFCEARNISQSVTFKFRFPKPSWCVGVYSNDQGGMSGGTYGLFESESAFFSAPSGGSSNDTDYLRCFTMTSFDTSTANALIALYCYSSTTTDPIDIDIYYLPLE